MASFFPHEGDEAGGIVAEINITPLTDVFLVLLIIFMVTSSVIAHTGKKVDLPEATQQAQTPPQAVSVTLTADDADAPITRDLVTRPEVALVDYTGGSVYFDTKDTLLYERQVRNIAMAMGGMVFTAEHPMTGIEAKRAIVPDTISFALEVGRALARWHAPERKLKRAAPLKRAASLGATPAAAAAGMPAIAVDDTPRWKAKTSSPGKRPGTTGADSAEGDSIEAAGFLGTPRQRIVAGVVAAVALLAVAAVTAAVIIGSGPEQA